MRIKCLHGFFIFEEEYIGDISDFMSLTGWTLVPRGTYYTFEKLLEAPDYSLVGKTLVDTPAVKTFAGKPWEVFEANAVVYDFVKALVVPIATIVQAAKLEDAGNYYLSNGLILPGSILPDGRVTGYDANFSFNRQRWIYKEVTYA